MSDEHKICDEYASELEAKLAAKTNECVALVLAVEKAREQIKRASYQHHMGIIQGYLAKALSFLTASATAKQLIEEHDRKVRAEIIKTFEHIHVADTGTDACKDCGLDLRHQVHEAAAQKEGS